jgi:hypothetical protein
MQQMLRNAAVAFVDAHPECNIVCMPACCTLIHTHCLHKAAGTSPVMLSAADFQCIRLFTLHCTHTKTEPLLHQLHECRYHNRWQEGLRLLSVALGQSVEPSATVHAAVTAAIPQTLEAYSALLDVYAKVSTMSCCTV